MFRDIQIVVIMNLAVVSSVGINWGDCSYVFIYVLLCLFPDELEDRMQTKHIFAIKSCIGIKGVVSGD